MINDLPTITFSEYADADTVLSVLNGWQCDITLRDGSTASGVVEWNGRQLRLVDDDNGGSVLDFETIVTAQVR